MDVIILVGLFLIPSTSKDNEPVSKVLELKTPQFLRFNLFKSISANKPVSKSPLIFPLTLSSPELNERDSISNFPF